MCIRDRMFTEQADRFLNLENSILSFKGDRLFISKKGFETEVYNLHIHSKDTRVFKPSFFRLLVRLRSYQSKKGPTSQLTYHVVTRHSVSLKLSILRNLKKLLFIVEKN